MTNSAPLIKESGRALMVAGALVVVVNAVITPLLPHNVPFSVVAGCRRSWRA